MQEHPWREAIDHALAPLPDVELRSEVRRGLEKDLEHAGKVGQFLAVARAAAKDLGFRLVDDADIKLIDSLDNPFPHEYDEALSLLARRFGYDAANVTRDRAVEMVDTAIHTDPEVGENDVRIKGLPI